MAKGIHRASKLAAKAIDSSPVSNAIVLSTAVASGAVSATSPLPSVTALFAAVAASGTVSTASPVSRAAVFAAASVLSVHAGSAYHCLYYKES